MECVPHRRGEMGGHSGNPMHQPCYGRALQPEYRKHPRDHIADHSTVTWHGVEFAATSTIVVHEDVHHC